VTKPEGRRTRPTASWALVLLVLVVTCLAMIAAIRFVVHSGKL
jgi:hypothetical protein